MDVMEFIKPEFFIIAPVLYVIGTGIKHSEKLNSKYIPLALCGIGVFFALLYVLATSEFGTWQDVLLAVFVALTQGFLVAGAAVFANQLIKQTKKDGTE